MVKSYNHVAKLLQCNQPAFRVAYQEYLALLTPDVQLATYQCLRKRMVDEPGVFVHAIGGVEDHVHIAVTIPPTLTISDFIGKLKGGSSHDVNDRFGRKQRVLEWQAGYGVVSFGTGDLGWVTGYIANQREHHARQTSHDRLERITRYDDTILGDV